MTRFTVAPLIALALLAAPAGGALAVVYVDQNAHGPAHDGLSWATAFLSVQEGVSAAQSEGGDQVWVADGAYYEALLLGDRVQLFGGFQGTEESLEQRDPVANETILDGSGIQQVVLIHNASDTIIDGFIIQHGMGTDGAGIDCLNSTATITNNLFRENATENLGGGLRVSGQSSTATVSGNRFLDNEAGYGGGVGATNQATLTLTGNEFRRNVAMLAAGAVTVINKCLAEIRGNLVTENVGGFCGGIRVFNSVATIEDNVVTANSSTNGSGAGIFIRNYATVVISNNQIISNVSSRNGAGIQFGGWSTGTIEGNVIEDNSSTGNGGGIYIYLDSYCHVTGNTIARNRSECGAGIMVMQSDALIEANTIEENEAYWWGGGLGSQGPSEVALVSNTLSGNTANLGGGLCVQDATSDMRVTGNLFEENAADHGGGLMAWRSAAPVIEGSTFRRNHARIGGAMCVWTGTTPHVEGNLMELNDAYHRGGAVYGMQCDLRLKSNTITENTSLYGGAMYIEDGDAYIDRNEIAYNRSDLCSGGGLYLWKSVTTVAENYIHHNMALDRGGGIFTGDNNSGSLSSNLVIANRATMGGGIAFTEGGIIDVSNNTVAQNAAEDGAGIAIVAVSGTLTNNIVALNDGPGIQSVTWSDFTLARNDVWGNSGPGYMDMLPGETDVCCDPSFVDPSLDDFHLAVGSECIDAGDNEALCLGYLDIDGGPRICDGDGDATAIVDIGADEYREEYEANAAPAEWFVPGWVWFSIPLEPRWSADASDVLGFDCANRLYFWHDTGKAFILYPDDFTDLEVGLSYILLLRVDEQHAPVYEGLQPELPFERRLPAAGWCSVGVPSTQEILGLNLTVTKAGATRTPTQDRAAPDPWLNWNWIYWDPVARAPRIMDPIGSGDDEWVHPWWGYFVWVNAGAENVTIIFP
jgi:parallel beta-helix repeat protein